MKRKNKSVIVTHATLNFHASECLSKSELASVILTLKRDTALQNRLIKDNTSVLIPHGSFGNMTARRLIKTAPGDAAWWRNRFWSLIASQSEASRLLQAYQQRLTIFNAIKTIRDTGASPSLKDVKNAIGASWLDRQLFKNLSRSSAPPSVPTISSARMPYSLMATQVSSLPHYDHRTGALAWDAQIGKSTYAFRFDAPWLKRKYSKRRLQDGRISRPTLQVIPREAFSYGVGYHEDGRAYVSKKKNTVSFSPETDDVLVSFTITLYANKRGKPSNHVAAFDLGMDSTKPFSGVRMSPAGVSRELIPSHQAEATRLNVLKTKDNLKRGLAKLTRLKQCFDKLDRTLLESAVVNDYKRVERQCDALDWQIASDMVRHCKPGDVLVMEELAWSGGGPVKFRHGRVQARVDHVAGKRGVTVRRVNPAFSSQECARCGSRRTSHRCRLTKCGDCGYEADRDKMAAVVLARRGLEKIKRKYDVWYDPRIARGPRHPAGDVRCSSSTSMIGLRCARPDSASVSLRRGVCS